MNRSTPRKKNHTMSVAIIGLSLLAGSVVVPAFAENISFPKSNYVRSIKALGAIGDGVTDDTRAFLKLSLITQGIIYIPNGIYRLTDTITFGLQGA